MEDPTKLESSGNENKTEIKANTTADTKAGEFVAGTVLASRYRIIGLIGKGGMGEVYKAEDIKLSQMVALKFLPDSYQNDGAALERFHGEVRNARQVSHVNVCRVFDIGEIDGRHFLSMEFVDGDDLSALLTRVGRFTSERAVEIARQLCVGMEAIHKAGILHRDLKPGNIIIDSKGVARITDFGIAGIEAEMKGDNIRAGTPAYMSPEQITGKEVTVRSDIYALGLVIYEIFTGKQAFIADNVMELIKMHQTATQTNPSEIVKGIDPLVESVIAQCLEKDPKNRPQSALQVAMALPGGNPMQIALDAGQTPSPEMVAASPKKGALKPLIASCCLFGGIVMLLICLVASMKVGVNNRIPLNKSLELLSEKANEIIDKLGYTDPPFEEWSGLRFEPAYANSISENPKPEDWERLESGRPLVVTFDKRQSPNNFEIVLRGDTGWEFQPQTKGGERTISLDTRGRLVEFSAVPVQYPISSEVKTDFSEPFQAAELDLAKFRELQPEWIPPYAYDERKAWEGALPDDENVRLRVEAAGFQGKVVFFKLVYPWTKPDVTEADSFTTRDWVGIFTLAAIVIGVVLAACFLAWHNLRSGKGDRKGASKIAFFVLASLFAGWFLSMNHVPSFFPELDRFSHSMRIGLYFAAWTWVFYVALEPIIRRNLPDLIVSWNRMLAGDLRDPLVGRDILIGTLWGIAHVTLIYLGISAERLAYGDVQLFYLSQAFTNLNSWLAMVLAVLGQNVTWGFLFICFFVIVFLVVRRRLYAWFVLMVLISAIELLLFSRTFVYVSFSLVIAALWSLVVTRAGLVATIVGFVVFAWLRSTLLTTNFTAWYANNMFWTLGLIIVLLLYGFYTSTAGQKLWQGKLLGDES